MFLDVSVESRTLGVCRAFRSGNYVGKNKILFFSRGVTFALRRSAARPLDRSNSLDVGDAGDAELISATLRARTALSRQLAQRIDIQIAYDELKYKRALKIFRRTEVGLC